MVGWDGIISKGVRRGGGMYSPSSGWGLVAGFDECGDKPPGCGATEFVDNHFHCFRTTSVRATFFRNY
jgi:hypothetical protein